jgi:hypothetical protein
MDHSLSFQQALVDKPLDCVCTYIHEMLDRRADGAPEVTQNPVRYFGIGMWRAPYSQAEVIPGAKVAIARPQTIVAAMSTADLKFHLARFQVDVVVRDDD